MASIREALQRPAVKGATITIVVLAIAAALWQAIGSLGQSAAASESSQASCVCAETGKGFKVTLKEGMTFPIDSPYTGKKTGYPAELCYWTKDGQIKSDPTPVLLNSWVGKRDATFCPDCGRLVVPHNPTPAKGANPPPLKQDYGRNRSNDQ